MTIKGILFDCDGVLLESVDIKTEAFAQMFRDEGPEVVRKVIQHHKANGGMSRAKKFLHYYREFLRRPLPAGELEALCSQFQAIVLQRVVAAQWVPGAEAALEFCRSAGYMLFVASGTPQDEIELILEQRGVRALFSEIFGSPTEKSDAVRSILTAYQLRPRELVVVGDSLSDLEAAEANSTHFIARNSGDLNWEMRGYYPISDLAALASRLSLLGK